MRKTTEPITTDGGNGNVKLSGQQIQRIHNAILAGYSPDSLRMMVRMYLEENLHNIGGGTTFSEQVFTLLEWAERQGRVLELIRVAQQANPNNATLQTLLKDAQTWFVAPATESTPPLTANPMPFPVTPSQVFLSYSRHDRQAMRRVLNLLQTAGIQVWTDEGLEPGTAGWQAAIENAIRQTQCMIVLLSPEAKSSKWVNIEVSFAQQLGRRIFPLLTVGDNTDSVPLTLFNTQYVDGRSDLENEVTSKLLPALRSCLGLSDPLKLLFDWILIPAGKFMMGSIEKQDELENDNETVQHQIMLPDYRILRTPITVAQFALFVKSTGYKTTADKQGSAYIAIGNTWETVKGANWAHPGGRQTNVIEKANHPVTCISWHDAQAFCAWASKELGQIIRLPSEAEWEKAARGIDGRLWPWGNQPPTDKHCNFHGYIGDTTQVDNYSEGASPYGVLDMAGNVWEWTRSLHKLYPYNTIDGREDMATEGDRILRGGSWNDPEFHLHCSYRNSSSPDYVGNEVGFRVVSANYLED